MISLHTLVQKGWEQITTLIKSLANYNTRESHGDTVQLSLVQRQKFNVLIKILDKQ